MIHGQSLGWGAERGALPPHFSGWDFTRHLSQLKSLPPPPSHPLPAPTYRLHPLQHPPGWSVGINLGWPHSWTEQCNLLRSRKQSKANNDFLLFQQAFSSLKATQEPVGQKHRSRGRASKTAPLDSCKLSAPFDQPQPSCETPPLINIWGL